jgi:hypothetical protein
MFRIVVKATLTRALAGDLLTGIERTLEFLMEVGSGYAAMHAERKAKAGTHAVVC